MAAKVAEHRRADEGVEDLVAAEDGARGPRAPHNACHPTTRRRISADGDRGSVEPCEVILST